MLKRTCIVLVALSFGAAFAGYVEEREAAAKLIRARKHAEAMTAFEKMAAGEVSDFQKSDALEQAALCARRLKNFDHAMELAKQIPLAPVAKAVEMRNLLENRKSKDLVEKFKEEDIDAWPESVAGDAFYCRGRAFADVKNGEAAEADLKKAANLIAADIPRARAWLSLAVNYEQNLNAKDKALETYQTMAEKTRSKGKSVYLQGLLGGARILREQKRYDEARAMLNKVEFRKFRGWWKGAMLFALAEMLVEEGKKEEAVAACKEILADEKTHPRHKKSAQATIEKLAGKAPAAP